MERNDYSASTIVRVQPALNSTIANMWDWDSLFF